MKRAALNNLRNWKATPNHKPLLLQGARQVGKTWLMREFGRLCYRNTACIGFEGNPRVRNIFAEDLDPRRILLGLEAETRMKIIPGETLIVFDEIQECPMALAALKYFNENAPEYDIIAAGSLLGVFLHSGVSFPVGKVDFMSLWPLTFLEFLDALGEGNLSEILKNHDEALAKVFHDKLLSLLRLYFYTGGMPEVVRDFAANRNLTSVRAIQKRILKSYEGDFSKHVPRDQLQKVVQIWDAVPSQLAKENKKFIYKEVRKGGRAAMFETAFEWLGRCGLVHRVARVSKPALPLSGYENESGAFKVFLSDIGLLVAKTGLDSRALLEGDALFTEFKGALAEQFVCQELKTIEDLHLAYWANEPPARAEIDFLVQFQGQIIPVEVKAATNLRAKSLAVYREKFHPQCEIRASQADFKTTGNLRDIPLYALAAHFF